MAQSISKQELMQKQSAQTLEQEQLVGYWLSSKGISKKALDNHPYIDDVILLMKWRDSMWNKLNRSEQAVWGAFWGYTYNHQMPLKNKTLKKLEQITITATDRHLQSLVKAAEVRQRIKALKTEPLLKSTDDIAAKAVRHAQTPPWE